MDELPVILGLWLAVSPLLATWLLGRKRAWGWGVVLANDLLWIVYWWLGRAGTEMIAPVPIYFGLHVWYLCAWRSTPASAPVTIRATPARGPPRVS